MELLYLQVIIFQKKEIVNIYIIECFLDKI